MAIKDEIQRITKAKQDFKTKLIEKGVTVSDEELISDYPPKLDLIKGGANTTDATATANEIRKGFTAYVSSGKVEGAIEDYDGAFEILVTLPQEPEIDDFPSTSSLVYTLSSDGTYYIVGTGQTKKENVITYTSGCIAGSGLDSTWSGGELYIPNEYNGLPVLAINSYAFKNVTNITACYIQDGITHIGKEVLNGCYNIKLLSLPFVGEALEPIDYNPIGYIFGETTYNDCYIANQRSETNFSSIYSAKIPNALTKIIVNGGNVRGYNFSEMKNIQEIIFRENILFTFNRTFENCYSLTKLIFENNEVITLPNTIVFKNCYHFTGTVNSTYNPNGDKDGYIYVPDSLVESYKTATNWSTYASQIKPLSELEE